MTFNWWRMCASTRTALPFAPAFRKVLPLANSNSAPTEAAFFRMINEQGGIAGRKSVGVTYLGTPRLRRGKGNTEARG